MITTRTKALADDTYDPELHGTQEQEPPAAQRGMALSIVVLLFSIPYVLAWALS